MRTFDEMAKAYTSGNSIFTPPRFGKRAFIDEFKRAHGIDDPPKPPSFLGIEIKTDPTLPPGTCSIRSENSTVRVSNIYSIADDDAKAMKECREVMDMYANRTPLNLPFDIEHPQLDSFLVNNQSHTSSSVAESPATIESMMRSMDEIMGKYGPAPHPLEIIVRPDPVIRTSVRVKTHRRSRIDKKWRKRYGYRVETRIDTEKAGEVLRIKGDFRDHVVMCESAYNRLVGVSDSQKYHTGDTNAHSLYGVPIRRVPY